MAANRLQQDFNVDAPDKVWVTDITYIREIVRNAEDTIQKAKCRQYSAEQHPQETYDTSDTTPETQNLGLLGSGPPVRGPYSNFDEAMRAPKGSFSRDGTRSQGSTIFQGDNGCYVSSPRNISQVTPLARSAGLFSGVSAVSSVVTTTNDGTVADNVGSTYVAVTFGNQVTRQSCAGSSG